MKRFFAFTLAETLIVMGIIGIVSALTLPNLNSSTGEKEKVAKVKKIYQNLNDAYGRATAIYGPIEEWFLSDTTEAAQKTRFYERMTEFMKTSKTDATNSIVILADGTQVLFELASVEKMNISIDLDGPHKGKNTYGSDLFGFTTAKCKDATCSGYLYDDFSEFRPPEREKSITKGSSTIKDATSWVIDYDNMDYLKLDSSGKCPNGKALNVLANPPVISCR